MTSASLGLRARPSVAEAIAFVGMMPVAERSRGPIFRIQRGMVNME
jgi:hypothetical protein